MNYNFFKTHNIMELNKQILNIHQLSALLLFDVGVKIAVPYNSSGSQDRPF